METDSVSRLVIRGLVLDAFEEESKLHPVMCESEIESLGIDSLNTVVVMQQIEMEVGIVIPDDEAAQFVTVQDVIDYIEAALAR